MHRVVLVQMPIQVRAPLRAGRRRYRDSPPSGLSFVSENISCSGTQQAVFCVTRNIFGNAKQLARKGEKPLRSRRFAWGIRRCRGKFLLIRRPCVLSVKILLYGKGKTIPKQEKRRPAAQNCIMIRLTDEKHARFLTMFEQSGVYTVYTI